MELEAVSFSSFCSASQSALCCNIHACGRLCAVVQRLAAQGSAMRSNQTLRGLLGIEISSLLTVPWGLRLPVLARDVCLLLLLCTFLFFPRHLTPTQSYQRCAPALSTHFQHPDYRGQLNIDSVLSVYSFNKCLLVASYRPGHYFRKWKFSCKKDRLGFCCHGA